MMQMHMWRSWSWCKLCRRCQGCRRWSWSRWCGSCKRKVGGAMWMSWIWQQFFGKNYSQELTGKEPVSCHQMPRLPHKKAPLMLLRLPHRIAAASLRPKCTTWPCTVLSVPPMPATQKKSGCFQVQPKRTVNSWSPTPATQSAVGDQGTPLP